MGVRLARRAPLIAGGWLGRLPFYGKSEVRVLFHMQGIIWANLVLTAKIPIAQCCSLPSTSTKGP